MSGKSKKKYGYKLGYHYGGQPAWDGKEYPTLGEARKVANEKANQYGRLVWIYKHYPGGHPVKTGYQSVRVSKPRWEEVERIVPKTKVKGR